MPMLVLSGEKAGGEFLIEQVLVDTNVRGVVKDRALADGRAPDQVIPALVKFLNQ